MVPRSLYDLTALHSSKAGVSGAARDLWDGLSRVVSPPIQLEGVDSGLRRDMEVTRGLKRKVSTLRIDLEWSQVRLPLEASRRKVDLLVQPSGFPPLVSSVPVLAVVHDIFPLTNPEWFPAWHRTWSRMFLGRALKSAAGVLASSKATSRDLQNVLGIDPARIRVQGLGCSPSFRRLDSHEVERFRGRHGLGRYVLCVGSLEPRKNLKVLVQAMRIARSSRPDLEVVHAGPNGWLEAGLGEPGESWIRRMGHVPQEDLVSLYNAAAVFVFPSLAEGFGLPVLEAMRCGTPVIHSDLEVLHEISAGTAVVFDPMDPHALASRILQATVVRPPSEVGIEEALRRSRDFGWNRYAEALLEFGDRIVRKGGRVA